MADQKMQQFREEIQRKMRDLLAEFATGKLSTQQFNILYERYNNQLDMATQVIEGQSDVAQQGEMSTLAIREATAGKAIGLAVYHHRSGTIIETLGNFDLPPDVISPTLNEFSSKLESRQFIEPVSKMLPNGLWVVFMARMFTTAIFVFRNEPAPRQLKELVRLQHDFEEANRHLLDRPEVDKEKLAKPFLVLILNKMTK
jgi:hypothetical protein